MASYCVLWLRPCVALAYLIVRECERVYEARAPALDLVVDVLLGRPAPRAAAAAATRVARVGRRQEAVRRPEGERHVLQHERQQAQRVLRVLRREGVHVRVAVERAPEQPVQIAVHLQKSRTNIAQEYTVCWYRQGLLRIFCLILPGLVYYVFMYRCLYIWVQHVCMKGKYVHMLCVFLLNVMLVVGRQTKQYTYSLRAHRRTFFRTGTGRAPQL